ncbi:hypothetical protein X798_07695 [Onchocerca flexuosa]|uniref:Uncharacterized protein n=1 Tax=Onchocerca flexuosa TaxID=387005 RepID=A0A238BJ92_9BILA|nr:hypothetical protein X798_07695 [Onchocerca flexuosa]
MLQHKLGQQQAIQMVFATCFLPAITLFSISLISSSSATIYNPRRIVLPIDEEMQREMINDLLLRDYADRYREYIEKALTKNNLDDLETLHSGNKRGQTFVRFGKKSQFSFR